MSFPERIKSEAKRRAAFRCCICHRPFVEVHHIKPAASGGADILDNAAPLCSSCHDLFGGNPDKQKQIRQMRDAWWKLMEERKHYLLNLATLNESCRIEENPQNVNQLKSKPVVLYHCVFADETFEDAAQALFTITQYAQRECPNQRRVLFLDIDEHKNSAGGFDWDMYELQVHFILEFLLPYLYEAHFPLMGVGKAVRNPNLQRNGLPAYLFHSLEAGHQKLQSALSREGRISIEEFKLGQKKTS